MDGSTFERLSKSSKLLCLFISQGHLIILILSILTGCPTVFDPPKQYQMNEHLNLQEKTEQRSLVKWAIQDPYE